jgi:hypothetical protein
VENGMMAASGVDADLPAWADRLPARIGSVGVYATSADLSAQRRTRAERASRTLLTFAATLLATPLGFLIPPHLEPALVVFLIGLYFTRRAWVGEWEVLNMAGTCPRCDAAIVIRAGTVLYLPHSLTCARCRAECWLELGAAAPVADDTRHAAMTKAREQPVRGLGGKPPVTWSPAASDWRDRRRTPSI